MKYDRCPLAEQIRTARAAGAEPGTVFVPKPPEDVGTGVPQPLLRRRQKGERSMTKTAVRLREKRARERLLAGLGIGGAA